jgi:hypothetical protein
MGGWHLRMTWGQEVCYTSLNSEPASALSLPTVWLHWGNPGVARCWEMATLPTGYIPQFKVPSTSSSGSLGFIVCSFVGWLIVYQLGILSLSCSQYSHTICWHVWDDSASSIGAWPNSLDWRPLWYCIVSPLLQTNKEKFPGKEIECEKKYLLAVIQLYFTMQYF